MTFPKAIVAIVASASLAGCATGFWHDLVSAAPPEDYGHSVNNMIQAQTANPDAGKTAQAPEGMDGAKAAAAVNAYRSAKPAAGSAEPVPLNVNVMSTGVK